MNKILKKVIDFVINSLVIIISIIIISNIFIENEKTSSELGVTNNFKFNNLDEDNRYKNESKNSYLSGSESIKLNKVGSQWVIFTFNQGYYKKSIYSYIIEVIDETSGNIHKTFEVFPKDFSGEDTPQMMTFKSEGLMEDRKYIIKVTAKGSTDMRHLKPLEEHFITKKSYN